MSVHDSPGRHTPIGPETNNGNRAFGRSLLAALTTFAIVCFGAWLYSTVDLWEYDSTAILLINPTQITPGTSDEARDESHERFLASQAAWIESAEFADQANERLGFTAEVMAISNPNADLIEVTASDPDPELAPRIARTFAQTYIDARTEQVTSDRRAAAEQLENRIEELDQAITVAETSDAERLRTLREDVAIQLDRLRVTMDLDISGARIIDVSTELTPPRSSNALTSGIAIATVLGALAGIITFLVCRARP